MRGLGGRCGWLTLAITLAASLPLCACEFLVRDAAFRAERDIHRLCLIAHAGDPAADQIAEELTAWLAGDGADLNVDLERVDVDNSEIEWSRYGIPSAPPASPVVVLVGTNHETGRSFVIDHWEPSPKAEDLERLAQSPIRTRLQEELGRNLAVVLYAPCSDCNNEAVAAMLQHAADHWREDAELGVSLVEIDRTDPAERLLLRFAGIRPEGQNWVGVVFGRGKLMNPPLVGEEITRERVDELVQQVLAECACTKPLPTLGVDLPLLWPNALDEAVIELSTPDTLAVAALNQVTGPAQLVPIEIRPAEETAPAAQPVDDPPVTELVGFSPSPVTLGIVACLLGIAVCVWGLFGRRPA